MMWVSGFAFSELDRRVLVHHKQISNIMWSSMKWTPVVTIQQTMEQCEEGMGNGNPGRLLSRIEQWARRKIMV